MKVREPDARTTAAGPNRTCAAEERRRADEGAAHDWFSQRVGEADAHCRPEWLGWDVDCRLRAGEGQQEAGDHNNKGERNRVGGKGGRRTGNREKQPAQRRTDGAGDIEPDRVEASLIVSLSFCSAKALNLRSSIVTQPSPSE